jgi:hypothetical protein
VGTPTLQGNSREQERRLLQILGVVKIYRHTRESDARCLSPMSQCQQWESICLRVVHSRRNGSFHELRFPELPRQQICASRTLGALPGCRQHD